MNDILNKIIEQDYSSISNKIQNSLKQKLEEIKSNGVIFGLSGGVDSVVTAYLCANSIKDNTTALILPDSKISPKEETEDAIRVVDELGLNYRLLDINLIHGSYAKNLEPDDKALGNLSARIRKNIIYYYANAKNLTVLGTSDKTEHLIGYFTKFGDGAADLLPISSLYKNQVRGLAKYLDVPDSIIKKKSSPNLWKNHFAEIELDASYEQIDCVLYCIFDEKISIDETVKRTEIDKSTVEKIYNLYKKSKHKRITPEML
jgi:NAD+ synthase